MNNRFIETISK